TVVIRERRTPSTNLSRSPSIRASPVDGADGRANKSARPEYGSASAASSELLEDERRCALDVPCADRDHQVPRPRATRQKADCILETRHPGDRHPGPLG